MKHAFRDRLPALLICVAFVMAVCLTVLMSDSFMQLYRARKKTMNSEWYAFSKYVTVFGFTCDQDILLPEVKKALKEINELESTVGIDLTGGNMAFFSGGALPEDLKSGTVINGEQLRNSPEEFVYINREAASSCEEYDGRKYYSIRTNRYLVQGMLYSGFGEDEKVFRYVNPSLEQNDRFLIDNITENIRQDFGITFFIGGKDERQVKSDTDTVLRVLTDNSLLAEINSSADEDDELEMSIFEALRAGVFILIIMLSLGSLYNSLGLWLFRRRRNFAIGMALGYPRRFMIALIMKELLPLLLIGSSVACAIGILYGYWMSFRWTEILKASFWSILFCCAVGLFQTIMLFGDMMRKGFLDRISVE